MKKTNNSLEKDAKKQPEQMLLPFIFPTPEPKYSNTIELYDVIPKYYRGSVKQEDRINGRFLESFERKFEFRGKRYKVKIIPARIKDKDNIERDYYPGVREELVEDALRKIACDGSGVFLDEDAGVLFTLYQIQQELTRMGHNYNINQIKEAIYICQKTNMELTDEKGTSVVNSHLFETIGLRTKEDWKGTGKKTQCFVKFNLLVTKSIKDKSFRLLNYEECMRFKKHIARYLHKRMSHLYIQASWDNSYDILLTTLIRDSGVKEYKELRNNKREVVKALKEMKASNIIGSWEEIPILNGRKIMDVKFVIKPGHVLIRDMKKANVKFREIKTTGSLSTPAELDN